MSQIVGGAKDTKTVVFPSTVRATSKETFSHTSVQSVILSERLKTISFAIFHNTEIKKITIPKSVIKIGDSAFVDCENLREVVFEEGSKLEEIGWNCFWNSGLEEITLPKALKDVCLCTFENCRNLKTIYVEDGCEADLFNIGIPDSTQVGPLPETMVGSVRVWGLRDCKDVVIPDVVERIGNSWFYGCGIESAEIPASVKYIDANAFCKCKNLERVAFAEGS